MTFAIVRPNPTRLFHDYETKSRADLTKVGSSRYSRDPSTRVQMVGWAFDDGEVRQWTEDDSARPPAEFTDALEDSRIMKNAWNAAFEKNITANVLGIPVDHAAYTCTMTVAMSLALPGKLEVAGQIIRLDEDLLKVPGKVFINKFAKPRKPTKSKPWEWADSTNDPWEWLEYCHYNRQDVRAERAIWKKIRKYDFGPTERALYELDQEINAAGIPINLVAVRNAIRIRDHAKARLMRRMVELTGLANPNSGPQILPWLKDHGYPFDDLKKGHIERALERVKKEMAEAGDSLRAREEVYAEVLDLRAQISKTSVTKFDALERATDEDGNLRNTFQFAGAGRTNRWAGRIFQPQNLAKPPPELEKAVPMIAKHVEVLDPEEFEMLYARPIDALSSAIRPMVQAGEEMIFADSDLSAIENIVLGWSSGEDKITSVFEQGRDPYLDFGQYMFGISYEALEAAFKAGDKSKRTTCKPGVLGCLGPDTLVLTERGWTRLVEVRPEDRVHDGFEWVSHDGVEYKGLRSCVNLLGVGITTTHLIETDEDEWTASGNLDCNSWSRGIELARSRLLATSKTDLLLDRYTSADAIADVLSRNGGPVSSNPTDPSADASTAQDGNGRPVEMEPAETSLTFSPIASTPFDLDVKIQTTLTSSTTGGVESSAGSTMRAISWPMSFPTSAQMGASKSTGKTTTGITSEATSAWEIEAFKRATRGYRIGSSTADGSMQPKSSVECSRRNIEMLPRLPVKPGEGCRPTASSPSNRNAGVLTTFDIENAGPRNRFVILTEDGPIVVHNCGYGLGKGAVFENEQTGELEATGLLGYAWNMKVKTFTLEDSERSVNVWRSTFTRAVEFWRELEDAAFRTVRTGKPSTAGPVEFRMETPFLRMYLPSGRALSYLRPQILQRMTSWGKKKATLTYEGMSDKKKWVRESTYGGKLTENVCQAIARDILGHGMLLAKQEGLQIRLHVHDQIVTRGRASQAERDLQILKECMMAPPPWAPDIPLNVGGFTSALFVKD